MSCKPKFDIEGISYSTETLQTPFNLYKIYYNDQFLDYVWEPQKWKGPNNEDFFAINYRNTENTNDNKIMQKSSLYKEYPITKDDTLNERWTWFNSLNEAVNHIVASEISREL